MKSRDLNKVLRLIVTDYKNTFGDSIGNLSTYRFGMSLIDTNERIKAICLSVSPEPIQKSKYLKRIFDHFVAEDYAIKDGNNNYVLTKIGYEKGGADFLQRTLEFLNKNPGLAIVISVVALFVSIGALCVSYFKP
ncbi:MAG: hypothetical protein ACI9IA_002386 [Enterobacterales bacterium]|jgi:hypothetical protein